MATNQEVADHILRLLRTRPGYRLEDVVVVVDDRRIVIDGRARSFYVLQLVLTAIKSALREAHERVAKIELVVDHATRKGTFHATCTRPDTATDLKRPSCQSSPTPT